MVAKLTACQAAVKGGVKAVAIVDGRGTKALGAFLGHGGRRDRTPFPGTR
jgi:acetylglutamate kinase